MKHAQKMEQIKKSLSKWFTDKELDTLEHLSNVCLKCNKKCGNLARLNECDNKAVICLNCLDDYYDSAVCVEYLFNCPCCGKQIEDYTII